MTVKKKGLGRNLHALLGDIPDLISKPASEIAALHTLPLSKLKTGKFQPRQDFNEQSLQDLADSIKAQGIIQPIVVRPAGKDSYEIIAGERRFRAAQLAGLSEIPVVIRDVNDEATLAMALIENIQREDLNPMDEAVALQRLIDEFTLTHLQVAEAVGKSRTAVSNILRLLGLAEEVKRYLRQGNLEMGHARALLSLTSMQQTSAAQVVVGRHLSVRETEQLVRRMLQTHTPKPPPTTTYDAAHYQQQISEHLDARVAIKPQRKGGGRVEIHFRNAEQLAEITKRMSRS